MLTVIPQTFAQTYDTAAVTYTSDDNTTYSVDVTYTSNETTTPESDEKVMKLTAGRAAYEKTLASMTEGVQNTERFYVRLLPGKNSVSVAENDAFTVNTIDINKAEAVTLKAKTEATGGYMNEAYPEYRQCLKDNPIAFDFDFPEGEYNIKVNYKNNYSQTLSLSVNGGEAKSEEIPWGDNTDKTRDFGTISLNQGKNSISLSTTDSNIWIDSIVITNLYSGYETLNSIDSTLRLEAEAKDADGNYKYNVGEWSSLYGDGSSVFNAVINANFVAMDAGCYFMTIRWGNKLGDDKTSDITLNGEQIYSGYTGSGGEKLNTKTFAVNLKRGVNNVSTTFGGNIIIDYIEFSPMPNVGISGSTLRLEAEDYAVGSWQGIEKFEDGTALIYSTGMKAEFAAKAGEYIMNVESGNFNWNTNALAIKINDEEVYNKYSGKTSGSLAQGCTVTNQAVVTLKEGLNTIEIPSVGNVAIDYIEFSKDANFEAEKYTYSLANENLHQGNWWGLTASYLGIYDTTSAETINQTRANTTSKPMGYDDAKKFSRFVYFPFETALSGNYILKVTYASGDESNAAVIVDPTVLPTNNDESPDYAAVSGSGRVAANGKWQSSYSYSESAYSAPYFTEKVFDLGQIEAGSHNFVFMYNETDGTNSGLAIRKVQLMSTDKIDGLYVSDRQLAAESIGTVSLSKLCANVSEANEFSAQSENDADKNTAAVFGYAYNNSNETKSFAFIAASYDGDGRLIAVSKSDNLTLGKGADKNLKLKVSTNGAAAVKAFMWNMKTLTPLGEENLFGK